MGQNQLMILPGASSSGAVSFGAGSVQTLTPAGRRRDRAGLPLGRRRRRRRPHARADRLPEPQLVARARSRAATPTSSPCASGPSSRATTSPTPTSRPRRRSASSARRSPTTSSPARAPVGKRVRVKGLPFKVVGVLDKKGANTCGQDQDDVLLLPVDDVQEEAPGLDVQHGRPDPRRGGRPRRALLAARGRDRDDAPRDPPPPADAQRATTMDDFTIRNMTEMLNAMTATTDIMTALLAGDRLGLAPRGRHRDHEHHARLRHRADARDRAPHGDRRARPRRPRRSSSSSRSCSRGSAACSGSRSASAPRSIVSTSRPLAGRHLAAGDRRRGRASPPPSA